MADWKGHLSYHGKSKDVCEWVVKTYDKPEYMNNMSVKLWVEASKQCLKELHNVR
jgi:hypothetical protein